MLLEKVKGMDDGCYHVRVIFLSWVELSFHLFLPFAQRRIEFQKTHQQKLGWSWLGGEIFPRVKLLFPPFWSHLIRAWSTLIQQRDRLQQLWPRVESSVPPWGKQKSFSTSWTWKSSRQPRWKGRFLDAGVEEESIYVVLTVTQLVWCVFFMDSSGIQHYDCEAPAHKEGPCVTRGWMLCE